MSDSAELERREAALKDAALTIAQAVSTLKPMVDELRAHVIGAKWMPLFGMIQVLLLSCILVALLSPR